MAAGPMALKAVGRARRCAGEANAVHALPNEVAVCLGLGLHRKGAVGEEPNPDRPWHFPVVGLGQSKAFLEPTTLSDIRRLADGIHVRDPPV